VTGASPDSRRRSLALLAFGLLALFIIVSDQLLKAWVVAGFEFDRPHEIVGDWLRIDLIHNAGGLFGMLQGTAPILALISTAVVVLLVVLEFRTGWHSWLLTLVLGLLLGGAIGNFIDRLRFGYVVDFVDIGIGAWRFYIFNVADSAVTVSIMLVLAMAFLGPLLERGGAATEEAGSRAGDGAGTGSQG
jgi:signal peptidase II